MAYLQYSKQIQDGLEVEQYAYFIEALVFVPLGTLKLRFCCLPTLSFLSSIAQFIDMSESIKYKKKYFALLCTNASKQSRSRLEMKIKNQKVSLDVSQGKQKICWRLENLFDQRKYIGIFEFEPEEIEMLIQLTNDQDFSIKIRYESTKKVILDVSQSGQFTLDIAREPVQGDWSNEFETLNAFNVDDQEDEKLLDKKGKKVLHEQYDDLNPSITKYSNVFPYNSQVSIKTIYEVNGQIIITHGSGCLISPIIVLTCAHNVFNTKHRVKYTVMEVKPYGKHATDVIDCKFPEEFMTKVVNQSNYDSEYDYAILILQNYYVMKPLSLLANFQANVIAEIPGYPTSKEKVNAQGKNKNASKVENLGNMPDYNINTYKLKNARNLLQKFEENLIPHRISTAKGQSGSPILIELRKNFYFIIGIHVADDQENEYNLAVRLSPRILQQILSWCAQVPVPHSPNNFIKTVMPTVVDYNTLAPISPKDYGFSLRDVQKDLGAFQFIAKIKEQKGDLRKAAKYYGKAKEFKQQFKNKDIHMKIINMSLKVPDLYRQFLKQPKRVFKRDNKNRVKIPRDYLQLAKDELQECEKQASIALWYVQYYQLACQLKRRLIQFDEEGSKYQRHGTFERLAALISEEEVQSTRKYARTEDQGKQIRSHFNALKYQCYMKLGECYSYGKENKQKCKNIYNAFKRAEQACYNIKYPSPLMLIEVQLQLFHICIYQAHKLLGVSEVGLTAAIQYASKMVQNFRQVSTYNNKENRIKEQVISEISDGFQLIMERQLPKQDRPKIFSCIDVILQQPRIVFVKATKQWIIGRLNFI